MTYSKIIITFGSDFVDGDVLRFTRRKINDILDFVTEDETWVPIRTKNYEVTVATSTGTPGNAPAINYMKWFNIDYNGGNLYTLSRVDNVVTIECNSPDWEFIDSFSTSSKATFSIENYVPQSFQFIENYDNFLPASDVCGKVKITLETTELAEKIWYNGVYLTESNTQNPAEIEVVRGINYDITLEQNDGDKVYYGHTGSQSQLTYFDFLVPEKINLVITQSLIGATILINVEDTNQLVLEYSLDNVNWQTDNKFTGQDVGNGTVYVRDQFGCVKSKEYEISAFGSRQPYLEISRANDFDFVEHVDFDECGVYKNDENTLAHQGIEKIKYCAENLIQNCDPTTIQLKSNYETVLATLRKEDGTEESLTIEKMSSNLNRFASMDGKYYPYKIGLTGIYFENGNTYDENESITGTYDLSGKLPDFAIIGQWVTVKDFGTFQIVDKIFDEEKKKWAIIIEYDYSGEIQDSIITSKYDLLPFEVYEFSVDWTDRGEAIFDIVIENTDPTNGTVYHLTENINVASSHEDTVAIIYYNNNNRDVFYKYGIKHFLRVPIEYIRPIPKDETQVNITDDGTTLNNSTVQEVNEFKFDYVDSNKMKKIVVALSCENLFIQDIGYVKDGGVKAENNSNTNIHSITAQLIKSGKNFSINRDGAEEIFEELGYDIPTIITDGTNFIKS